MLTLTTTTSARATRQSASRRAVSVMGSWRNNSALNSVIKVAKRFVAAVRFGGSISSMGHACTSAATSFSSDYRNSTRNTRETVSLALAVPAVSATAALHT